MKYCCSAAETPCGALAKARGYHPDYLGSIEAVTDARGEVYQLARRSFSAGGFFHNTICHSQAWFEQGFNRSSGLARLSPVSAAPREGEPLQDQRAVLYNNFTSPFRFNGKERDWESGNYYYGARYYDPEISVWLGVDAMASEFPGWSPYNFVMGNPIILIDPDGNKVVISGSQTKSAFKQLRKSLKGHGIKLSRTKLDDGSYLLSYSRKDPSKKLDPAIEALLDAISSSNKNIEFKTIDHLVLSYDPGDEKYWLTLVLLRGGGGFVGADYDPANGGSVSVSYLIHPAFFSALESATQTPNGNTMLHEGTEAGLIAQMAMKNKKSIVGGSTEYDQMDAAAFQGHFTNFNWNYYNSSTMSNPGATGKPDYLIWSFDKKNEFGETVSTEIYREQLVKREYEKP